MAKLSAEKTRLRTALGKWQAAKKRGRAPVRSGRILAGETEHRAVVLRGAGHTLVLTKRIMLEYHSRALIKQVEATLKPYGFVREVLVEYYVEDLASGQEEVGITYYSRPITH